MKTKILFFFFIPYITFSLNYYWVGGTGNWSDLSHWATTSGGSILHTQVPTSSDNVFFDNNSGTGTVTIDQTIVHCHDMIWTGSSGLHLAGLTTSQQLHIYGSLVFVSGMNYNFVGEVYFRALTTGKNITTAGKTFRNVYFDGVGGGWTLLDAFSTQNYYSIYFNNGNLNTNNQNVTTSYFWAQSGGTKTLSLGSSNLNIHLYWYLGTNVTLNAGTSHIFMNSLSAGGGQSYFYGANKIHNNVTFMSEITNVHNNNVFNTITILAGRSVRFAAGSTQTLTSLVANGTCGGWIDIRSSSSGSSANLVKSGAGSINVTNVILTDNAASPGGVFNAANSVNSGNVSGWNITSTPPSNNYYWVGGTGNWSDPNRWSLSNGGPPNPGGCIPSPMDNVYFTNLSSSGPYTASVNVTGFCNDMNWNTSTTGILAGSNSQMLNIYGSLTFVPAMTNNFTGDVYFRASSLGKTITSAGKTFRNVYFDGVGGGWILQDAFTTQNYNSIYFYNGNLNTNSQSVTTSYFWAQSGGTKTLSLGSSSLNIHLYWYLGTNVNLNAGTSHIFLNSAPTGGGQSYFYGANKTHYNLTLMSGMSDINNNNVFNTITILPGRSVRFASSSTQTLTNLIANGTCGGWIDIRSTTSGTAANLVKSGAGSINVTNVVLTDNSVSPVGVFNAANSVNSGNVTGWNITSTPPSNNYYWVGGTGNWSDPNRWSLTNGGSPNPGGCIPSPMDNVYFTNLSSTGPYTASVNVIAFFNDMSWSTSTTGILAGVNPQMMNAYGSLTFVPAMTNNFTGNVYFRASSLGKTITSAGKSFRNVYFDGVGGGWTLQDAFTIQNYYSLYFYNGNLNTNNQTVTASYFWAQSGGTKTLSLGASTVNIHIYWYLTNNVNLNAGTSHIFINSTPAGGGQSYFYGAGKVHNDVTLQSIYTNFYNTSIINNLTILPGKTIRLQSATTHTILGNFNATGNPSFPVGIEAITNGSQGSFSKSSGIVCCDYCFIKDNNATGGATWYAQNSSNISNNSGWIFAPCVPLGITMLKFDGYNKENLNILEWTTTLEKNNDFFEIERSLGADDNKNMNWLTIGKVKGNGNSISKNDYRFTDNISAIRNHQNIYYYRLKQVDLDGSYQYYGPIIIQLHDGKFQSSVSVFPTVISGNNNIIKVTFNSGNNLNPEHLDIELRDINGKLMNNDNNSVVNMINNHSTVSFDYQVNPDLSEGIYFLTIKCDDVFWSGKIVIYNQ